jgi:hypothetical protein
MTRATLPTALLLLTAWGCGPTTVDIPQVPALQVAVDLFNHPTGTVPIEDVSAQVAAAGQRFDALDSSQLVELLSQGLASLRQREEANGLPVIPSATRPANKPKVDGFLRVTRTCRGWNDASTTPDPANGQMVILAVVRDRDLKSALSATATTCKDRVQVASTNVFVHPYVDGVLNIGLEGPLPRTIAETNMVVQTDATLGNEARTARLSFTFRVIYPTVEVAVPVNDGQIIVSRNPNGFEMRGSNGTFTCSIETGTCQ